MNRNTLARLTLILTLLFSLCAAMFAQGQKPTKSQAGPAGPIGTQETIRDAAGRLHARSKRITFAQRKAAAQRRVKAMRDAAAKRKQAEVKK